MTRTVHFLYRVRFGELLLGPDLRLWHLATQVAEAGHRVVVHVLPGSRNPFPAGIELKILEPGFTRGIQPGDAVVASELLPARPCHELLRSRLAFHWDCYGLSLPETLSFTRSWPASRSLGDRRRKYLRYRMLLRAAEKTWVSHAGQGVFLASLSSIGFSRDDAWLAFHAPSRFLEIPMGVSGDPAPCSSDNPYPAELQGRPVLLWGGGIWNWFDVPTVIQAMVRLREMDAPQALFFLSGRNEATRDYDQPLRLAFEAAERSGLLGRSIFFNDKRVTPDRIGPWLEHCAAGIMGNLPTLESRLSWRTRYLDLLWAGRPLVVSGSDPLAERMTRAGCALTAPGGDPEALALAIRNLTESPSTWSHACDASRAFGSTMRWRDVVRPFLLELDDPRSFRTPSTPPSTCELVRYAIGI